MCLKKNLLTDKVSINTISTDKAKYAPETTFRHLNNFNK